MKFVLLLLSIAVSTVLRAFAQTDEYIPYNRSPSLGYYEFWKEDQNHPRLDDHFWRRKIQYRIDLREKENEPIKMAESMRVYRKNEPRYGNKKGIIIALLQAFKEKTIEGYDPQNLLKTVTWEQFNKILAEKTSDEATPKSPDTPTDQPSDDEDNLDSPDASEPTSDDVLDTKSADVDTDSLSQVITVEQQKMMSYYLDVIEDRIFEKNKSDMYYDIQYITLSVVSPDGKFISRPIISFRYKLTPQEEAEASKLGKPSLAARDVLDNTQWKNRFNDAEYRTLREIFELRLFNSTNLIVSGYNEIASKEEAEKRRLTMLDFEHQLWNY